MAIYVVMEPPAGEGDQQTATFVRDGFSWLGFVVPPLWLLWHRLWIEAALSFIAMALLSALGESLGLQLHGSLLTLLVSLYIGLEGQGLRLAALRRRGWREWGVVEAAGVDDADMRYTLEAEVPPDPESIAAPRIVPDASQARPAQTGMALGIAHVPGRA